MRYRTFKGKTRQAAFAQLNLEKKTDPDLREARLIKHSEGEISSFMGLKKEPVYEIIVGIPEHSLSIADRPLYLDKNDIPEKLAISSRFTAVEKSVIKNYSNKKISTQAQDTLFALESVSRVAEQISKLQPVKKSLPVNKTVKKILTANIIESKDTELDNIKKDIAEVKDACKILQSSLETAINHITKKNDIEIIKELNNLPDDVKIHQQHVRWIERYLRKKEFSNLVIDDAIKYLEKKIGILRDKEQIILSIKEFLSNNITVSKINLDIYPFSNIVLFIGSSGVGKTISLTKMAAHIGLMRKKTFRFVSLDFQQAGENNALSRFAHYMNVPFDEVTKKEDLLEIIEKQETDFVFIDTSIGKNVKKNTEIEKLSTWIKGLKKNIDMHLVVSATTKSSDLEHLCETYSILNINHILVTKIDETKTFGSVLSVAYRYKKPFSFVTDGQEIPQDFSILDLNTILNNSLSKE